jgi:hypothetical protein
MPVLNDILVTFLTRDSPSQAKDADVMSMAELEDIVRQGEKDIAEGNFQSVAIDDLWK